ncbi:MAG: hypothetical protein HY248_03020, partial [Fimbriimonas ginsengisoli]|nr:hypothetical protein [Fimbriimonas ginsengisoli]
KLLGLPPQLSLPTDPVKAHATPTGLNRRLSKLALDNLGEWYKADIAFYERCAELRRATVW